MSLLHTKNAWSLLALLAASSLLCACDDELDVELEESGDDVELRDGDLSLCGSVPAHATVTLNGPGTYVANAPEMYMNQPGCDRRFVVDFINAGGGTVHLSPDLHHFPWTSASWPYDDESSCIKAHASMEVYTMPQIGVLTPGGSFHYRGEWIDGACQPVEIDDTRRPIVQGAWKIRLTTRAWVKKGICVNGTGSNCDGGTWLLYDADTWARAKVVVP
ncbi:hypothetical protein [Nannocystis radixulma]|uniref:Uncharacterized protein n=1 Tax=Nannocystis radixulma TaxID=2995305 RepID=A0ABT5BFD3_9BACT|nr:hypothetical protein [Nannocystis radixulma]MDC0672851.1 hypothetical protein [Nannocystis radixulma]